MRVVLNQVSFVYDKTVPALTDISFSAEDGETLCIAGANGSGKSTLLELIASAVRPGGGELYIEGSTGMVFQDVDNQLFMPTVWEDVAFGVLKRGITAPAAREAALAALRLVDAEALADRAPWKLSGGEKQRAALASVLVMKPDVLLLDEPTASLDPASRRAIIALLKNISGTKIIATHDLDMILDIADRVLLLYRGKIAAVCPAPGLLRDGDFLRSIGLDLPLTLQPRNG
ncbi:MAG: energy-coupling factor ABC transporter ATP-binding protein [Spirochaetaceae bacterium]|jgi:cobalt/nickel transport system ATP-binding protein|nr:energy-coupling factor ABC transporter ATP-binding protein [Spirochaetaceae bacterium]